MNRLVLIGNGFDLALGLKTGYFDFLIHLMKKYLHESCKNGAKYIYQDYTYSGCANRLFNIHKKTNYSGLDERIENLKNLKDIEDFFRNYSFEFKRDKSKLFELIYNRAGQLGWVDIEERYYTLLLQTLKPQQYSIESLNSDLDFLRDEVEEYLSVIDKPPINWDDMAYAMTDHFNATFQEKEIDGAIKDKQPDNICFVNFNYTKTVSQFVEFFKSYTDSKLQLISIHGNLKNKENPIIFGFGDEIDKNYNELEEKNDNRFFQHIKSFKYLKTKNYHNLIRFIDSGDYQVCIYGHSCGLSDRTMLREIFEHDNCKSIKIYYHQKEDGNDDFEEKTMEISRHFMDKGNMRRKIVDKTLCEPIPQNKLS